MNATATRADVVKGDVLGGKFRVERIVGRGGMGVVIEATNIQLDQKVALKLLAKGANDPAVVERFTREAKAAARLKSEHVARVYDVGKDPVYGPFIVMEMLDGQTLAEVVTSTGRIPLHRAAEHVIDACEGLAEAHARGIIHQDVKPGNLFLVTGEDGRPSVKLLDFGIATMRTKDGSDTDGKSSAPRSQGTPAYLSPEQLRGNPPVDHRADVWALGCVLYEILSGERAFRATRFTELVTKILESSPDTLPSNLELPAQVAVIIDRCLQKDPAKRFNSTGELALALLPFARRRAHSSVAKAVAHVKTGGLDPDLQMPSSMPPPPAIADSGPTDIASVPNLRQPSVPSFPAAAVASSAPQIGHGAAPRRVPIVIACVLGVVALIGGIFALTRAPERSKPAAPSAVVASPTTPPATPESATATAVVPASAVPAVAGSPPAIAPPPSIATNLRKPAAPAAGGARPRPPTAGGSNGSSSGTSGASPSGEAEIRHTR